MHRFWQSKISRYFQASLSALVLSGLFLAPLHAQDPQPYTPPKPPTLTPYQLGTSSFSSLDQAFGALNSKDILIRRSAVEYLGRATATDGASYSEFDLKTRADFASQTRFISSLTQAVLEMPLPDSEQAARLLGVMRTKAQSAIPAVCGVLSERNARQEFPDRDTLLSSLTQLCGGVDKIAPTLIDFLDNKNPETRRSVAAALGNCDDPTFQHSSPPPNADIYPWISAQQEAQWRHEFQNLVIPALAKRISDDDSHVRIAAAKSLENLTYDSMQAPWDLTVEPLAKMLGDTDSKVRLAAVEMLATNPGNVSIAAAALRRELRRDQPESSYAIAALARAAMADRPRTVEVFLNDLTSANTKVRQTAASDTRAAAIALWSGEFMGDAPGLPQSWNTRSIPEVILSMAPNEITRRMASIESARIHLLDALTAACGDRDAKISADAGAALVKISQWNDARLRHGVEFIGGSQVASELSQALIRASAALQSTHPSLSEALKTHPTSIY